VLSVLDVVLNKLLKSLKIAESHFTSLAEEFMNDNILHVWLYEKNMPLLSHRRLSLYNFLLIVFQL